MLTQYVEWLVAGKSAQVELVSPGTGAIVRHGISNVAVYRESAGQIHKCSAVCPHRGATVSWSQAEDAWKCPTHGSRFSCHGHVLSGPAQKDLQPGPADTSH